MLDTELSPSLFTHYDSNIFTPVCHSVHGGACMVAPGGACVVAQWHAWLLQGGVHGFIWGVCMVLFGGMHGFIRGAVHGFSGGACMVFLGGGMHGFFSFFGYNEIRSMSGRYASYWNAFLLLGYILASRNS